MEGKLKMTPDILKNRSSYSEVRLKELRNRFSSLKELQNFPNLTVFGAGSYARLEASEYSDLDVFFLCSDDKKNREKPRTHELRLFGRVIETIEQMNFPEFSNDCEYLVILHADQIEAHLGSPRDDYENYFTARMLLLLESTCLYGEKTYFDVISKIINSYFKDYYDHPQTFWPTFLLNDICRFWKTLLLNYENRRNLPAGADEIQKMKAKVKNFKLKFSRMTTCFASIAALGCHRVPVTEEQVMKLTKLTPQQRLQLVSEQSPEAKSSVEDVLNKYAWFLEMTGLPTDKLEEHFSDKQKRTEMFLKANDYGDSMFRLLLSLDQLQEQPRLLRYLVI
jgi:hypothetical protein